MGNTKSKNFGLMQAQPNTPSAPTRASLFSPTFQSPMPISQAGVAPKRASLFSPTLTSPMEKAKLQQKQEAHAIQTVEVEGASVHTGPTPCPAGPSPVRNERIYVAPSSEKRPRINTPKEHGTPKDRVTPKERGTPQAGKENDATPSNLQSTKSATPSKMPEIQITYAQKIESIGQSAEKPRAFGQRLNNQNQAMMECY
jgi:hypothetical protein